MGSQANKHEHQDVAHMLAHAASFIPYPAIERHGVIGDRRTAALVAADGTLDWLCLPDYDRESLFGALLDASRGGYWRLGPASLRMGEQRYLEESAVLLTTWAGLDGEIELTDAMEPPERARKDDGSTVHNPDKERLVLRRLRCLRGAVPCTMGLWPRHAMNDAARISNMPNGYRLRVGDHTLFCWSSFALHDEGAGLTAEMTLKQGDELWMLVAMASKPEEWSLERARHLLASIVAYWRRWYGRLSYSGPREELVKRSGMIIQLLGYEPKGSLVAAPTTSLPERVGGDRNYDYRYAWVRDASLSAATLVTLGDNDTASEYLHWLAKLPPGEHGPLQVVYHVNGSPDIHVKNRSDIAGYRGSLPVRNGNRAWKQSQLGSFGFVADCALDFVEEGGTLSRDAWKLLLRLADFSATHWRDPDSGIWELERQAQYVSSKVMSWVVLDRIIEIADRFVHEDVPQEWRSARDEIHVDVMERGWSERIQSFREHYDEDSVDAATLLIPVMGFLPADHPRVAAMVRRIESALSIEGQVYRFVPKLSPVDSDLHVGAFEGAFLPCTFWLATTYARMGDLERAERLLDRVEQVAGPLGLFAEELDPRTWTYLGNTPLLFSHAEYVRAVRTIQRARSGQADRGTAAGARA